MTSEQPDVNTDTGEVLDVVPVQRDALTEFGRDEIGMDRALRVANQLKSIIDEKELSVRIGNGSHLLVEAWCACASMVGVSPRTAWARPERSPSGELEGYEARVEVVQISTGQVIGAAEAGCYFDEKMSGRPRWTERHAVKSMAQTRATSKAIGQILRWIPVLAGYSGTPAEEMPANPQVWSPDGGGEEFTPRRPSGQTAQDERRGSEGKGDGSEPFPIGKSKGTPARDIDSDYLEWCAKEMENRKGNAAAKAELARRGESTTTPQEPEDAPATEEEFKTLKKCSYDRARILIDEVSLACGPLKHDTEDALAASIRKWALVFFGLEAGEVKSSHIESLRRAIVNANINADGETFIPADEGAL